MMKNIIKKTTKKQTNKQRNYKSIIYPTHTQTPLAHLH